MTRTLVLIIAIGFISGCSDDKKTTDGTPEATTPKATVSNVPDSTGQLRQQVTRVVKASCTDTEALSGSISEFLAKPKQASLSQAQNDWRQAHLAFRRVDFLYSLTDRPEPQIFGERDPIDATPMLAGYLDRVPGYPSSGLVYSEVPLSSDFLRKEHQSTDFFYLTLGFHPLEALLWPSDDKTQADKVTDFVMPETLPENEINVVARRRTLLRLIADQLQRDMAVLCKPDNVAYLFDALVELKNQRVSVLSRVAKRISNTTGKTLQGWASHPEGEDNNGLPVAHSPRALSDFSELATLTDELRERWLPLFLAHFNTESGDASQALAGLASRLREITPAKLPVPAAPLRNARQQLAKAEELLEQAADKRR